MKLTVLLNNYNYGRYVGAAIESVLKQTHGDFELVIVDDGSTDDSREIISQYGDARIIKEFKPNGGQASAFKVGVAKASGDYIAFLDADDLWDANKLARCVSTLSSEPDIVLLNHNYRTVDANGVVTGEPFRLRHSGVYDLLSDLRRLEVEFSLVPTSFFVGRMAECRQLVFADAEWKVGADTPVIVGLGLRGKIFNLDAPLGSYRVHGHNLWHGRYNLEVLFRHYQRFYRLANEELQRLGRNEHFDYLQSDFALDYQIVNSRRYLPNGIYHRLRKRFRRLHANRTAPAAG